LSIYPIVEYGAIEISADGAVVWDIPRVLWARLDLGAGHTVLVVNAHPISAVNTTYRCLFCSQLRDSQVRALREFLQPFIAQGEQVLLLGDMNTTDRELAYQDLAAGLIDTHLQVGNGNGHTWGIRGLNRFWAFLRIDYMFVTPNITPVSLETDCASRGSDHCVLTGQFLV
jgi:endonuclease/exonuclease/phosphatase family metal-dependent hydrolase